MLRHKIVCRLFLPVSVLGALLLWGCGAPNGPELEDPFMGGELAFPGKQGEEVKARVELPGFGAHEITYMKIEGHAVFGGDILLHVTEGQTRSGQAAARLDEGLHWPDGYIPYIIDEEVPEYNKQVVLEAMDVWQSKTPVRFGARHGEADYVLFKKGTGFSSFVGRKTGVQQLNFVGDDPKLKGKLLHEIGHVIGLWHEQGRVDRDDTVTIHWENIDENYKNDFTTYLEDKADGIDIGPYDINSIMHYGSRYAAKNENATITLKDGSKFAAQRETLTDYDIRDVESLYGMHLRLRSGLRWDRCLSVAGGSANSGANVQLGDCNQVKEQEWILTTRGELRSTLAPDRCLDVANSDTRPGSKVRLWDCNGTSAQQWSLKGGEVRSARAANRCLDVADSNTALGNEVRIWDCNGTSAQRWDDYVRLRSAVAWNRCLDVSNSSNQVGAKVQSWECNRTAAQEWFLTADNEVRSAVAPDRCLDVANSNTASGTEVRSWACNGTAAQKWSLTPKGELRSELGSKNLCLDVANGSKEKGASVRLWGCTDTQAQKWFRP